MQKLLSLPANLVPVFHRITGHDQGEWFVTADPGMNGIGSGGGTAWVLAEHRKQGDYGSFREYLGAGKKIVIHAGGQSRRLPAYAPSGKILAPVPVFRWSRGQRLDQSLLDLQVPLYERILDVSGPEQNTLVASGDVLILAPEVPFGLPAADVVCFGIWADPNLASRHGVFFTQRGNPQQLDFMLQKPEHRRIEDLARSHLCLMDIGIWILSNRAVELLARKCGWTGSAFEQGQPACYDLYGSFGTCLGANPTGNDPEIRDLSAAIVALDQGEFYHYGTSLELITSSERIQNRVQDQRNIWHYRVKPHPSLFVQNAITEIDWNEGHHHIWIENSCVTSGWDLSHDHVITGVPANQWNINLPPGVCLDIIPVGEGECCVRPYDINDLFRGRMKVKDTVWMGRPVIQWFAERGLSLSAAGIREDSDIQVAALFPMMQPEEITPQFLSWFWETKPGGGHTERWVTSRRLSAGRIGADANLVRLFRQREQFMYQNLVKLASNYRHSVFYQSDLKRAAHHFALSGAAIPESLQDDESAMLRFRNHMFRAETMKLKGLDGTAEQGKAFGILQSSIANSILHQAVPQLNIYADQIVWGRSPARLDLAGGWSDTPPYCLQYGGSVLNVAVELNGQPPIQVFIRLCEKKTITLRSIDNGASEVVKDHSDLKPEYLAGSVFSIPKTALCLAGFHPEYCGRQYASLEDQLEDFGGGFEISLLAAIPKGSGLGTSSILAATVLGALSDFCTLRWDNQAICHRTLILEQLLTTGGGWQDQYGGILPGIKLLESEPGTQEKMNVRWMPDRLFTRTDCRDMWLLYYTGVTRFAKSILAEIVRGMFLNEGNRLRILDEIRQHAYHMAEALQKSDLDYAGRMIAHSWKLNNALDSGTNTPEIQHIIDLISDYVSGLKLAGAGGGGYMLICAKDAAAAERIRAILREHPTNPRARFVKMDVSQHGFQVSRS